MNRRMFFTLLGAPLVAKKQLAKIKIPPVAPLKPWTSQYLNKPIVWKYRILIGPTEML